MARSAGAGRRRHPGRLGDVQLSGRAHASPGLWWTSRGHAAPRRKTPGRRGGLQPLEQPGGRPQPGRAVAGLRPGRGRRRGPCWRARVPIRTRAGIPHVMAHAAIADASSTSTRGVSATALREHRLERALLAAMAALVAIHVGVLLYHLGVQLAFPYDLNYGEGYVLND